MKIPALIAFLALSCSAFAETDMWAGRWKLTKSNSTFAITTAEDVTLSIQREGASSYVHTLRGFGSRNPHRRVVIVCRLGGDSASQAPAGQTICESPDPFTHRFNGDSSPSQESVWKLSEDGKNIVWRWKSVNAASGQPVESVFFFERQP